MFLSTSTDNGRPSSSHISSPKPEPSCSTTERQQEIVTPLTPTQILEKVKKLNIKWLMECFVFSFMTPKKAKIVDSVYLNTRQRAFYWRLPIVNDSTLIFCRIIESVIVKTKVCIWEDKEGLKVQEIANAVLNSSSKIMEASDYFNRVFKECTAKQQKIPKDQTTNICIHPIAMKVLTAHVAEMQNLVIPYVILRTEEDKESYHTQQSTCYFWRVSFDKQTLRPNVMTLSVLEKTGVKHFWRRLIQFNPKGEQLRVLLQVSEDRYIALPFKNYFGKEIRQLNKGRTLGPKQTYNWGKVVPFRVKQCSGQNVISKLDSFA